MTLFKIRHAALIIICLTHMTAFSQTGYDIRVQVPAIKDTSLILAHYFAKEGSFIPDDTVRLDKKGFAAFKGTKPLKEGMYIVLLPSRKYFDLLIGKNQVFTVEADTGDLLKGVIFTGSKENTIFYSYRNYINGKSQDVTRLNEQKKSGTDEQKKSVDAAVMAINQEVNNHIQQLINENQGLYFSNWLNALQEIEIPDYPRDPSGKVLDSTYRFKYWHQHYFDRFKLADQSLLFTPFYENKIKTYLEKAVPMVPDSLEAEIDRIMNIARENEDVFKYLLGFCYGHFANLANGIVGMDAVYIYYTEKFFLPNASWVDAKTANGIKLEIAKMKPTLIGKPAPDIAFIQVPKEHFLLAKTDTAVRSSTQLGSSLRLKDIKAKYLVLAFWESDCGHCIKEIPLLYDSVFPLVKGKDVKIMAIELISDIKSKIRWVDFVNEHKLYDWINALPTGSDYRDIYNVFSTPSIFILDENKKILAKRIGVEQIEKIIEFDIRSQSITDHAK